MDSIRAKINEVTGAVKASFNQTTGYFTDQRDQAVGCVKNKVETVVSQYNGIKNSATSEISKVQKDIEQGKEQLSPTFEFFRLHPVVGSLSVGAGVQATRMCKYCGRRCRSLYLSRCNLCASIAVLMRPTRLRWPLTASLLCLLAVKVPDFGTHIDNVKKSLGR